MAKLIQLDEAAVLLGMKPEDLVELRSRGELHGYRDGSTWKFKETELERFAGIQGITLGAAPAPDEDVVQLAAPKAGSGHEVDVDDDLDEIVDIGDFEELAMEDSGEELILSDEDVTEIAKTGDPTSSSTMIGKKTLDTELSELSLDDSGIDLQVDSSSLRLSGASDVISQSGAAPSGDDPGSLGSEVSLAPSDSGSELRLDIQSGSSLKLDMGSDVIDSKRGDDSGSGTGDLPGLEASDISLEDDDLEIDLGSSLQLSDDEMELSVESSEELILESSDIDLIADSGMGLSDPADSDVTFDASSSGINLSPSDSGLSLEQTPPELAMSGQDELELGEAEELVDFGEAEIELDDGEGLETDDFVLTPVEGDLGDEDSGSQVIALDTDELGDEGELLGEGEAEADMGAGLGTVEGSPGIPGPIVPAGAESPYTIYDVGLLGLIMMPLTLAGVMIIDVAMHIWSFNEPFSINSPLMDLILGMFGS